MTDERLADVKLELSLIRRSGQDSAGRYPELMREVRRTATREQWEEIRATLIQPPEEKPGPRLLGAFRLSDLAAAAAAPCECSACDRWETRRDMAWELIVAHPSIDARAALDRVLDLEGEIRERRRGEER